MTTQISEAEKPGLFGFSAKDEKDFQDCIGFCANELTEVIEVFKGSRLNRLDAGFDGVEIGMAKTTVVEEKPVSSETSPEMEEESLKPIASKYLGILRLNNEKNSPYVTRGSEVKPGQTIAIVKNMNMMNTIKAPVKGTIVEILENDGRPVEYGQTLFLMKTA
jgi:biotin carboxyl carrier protein